MSLIKCYECGKEISNRARVCPHCGAKRKSKIVRGAMYIFLFVMMLGFIPPIIMSVEENYRLAALTPEQRAAAEKAKAAAIQKPDAQAEASAIYNAVDDCRSALEQHLRDPDSVKYVDEVYTTPVKQFKDGTIVATIDLRARNGFGGMNKIVYLCRLKKNGDGNWEIMKLTHIE